VASSVEFFSALGQREGAEIPGDPSGTRTFEEGTALLAAEPYREQAILRLQVVNVLGRGVRVMTRAEATDLVDNIILSVYNTANLVVEEQTPVITRKVKRSVLGIEIGMLALAIAGTVLVSKALRRG
jgi:hypothetical protein